MTETSEQHQPSGAIAEVRTLDAETTHVDLFAWGFTIPTPNKLQLRIFEQREHIASALYVQIGLFAEAAEVKAALEEAKQQGRDEVLREVRPHRSTTPVHDAVTQEFEAVSDELQTVSRQRDKLTGEAEVHEDECAALRTALRNEHERCKMLDKEIARHINEKDSLRSLRNAAEKELAGARNDISALMLKKEEAEKESDRVIQRNLDMSSAFMRLRGKLRTIRGHALACIADIDEILPTTQAAGGA